MPFGLWPFVDWDELNELWSPDHPMARAILKGQACPDISDDTDVRCAKTAELIEMPFGL